MSSSKVDTAIHLYNLGWSLARVGQHLGTVPTKLRERGLPTWRHTETHSSAETAFAETPFVLRTLAEP